MTTEPQKPAPDTPVKPVSPSLRDLKDLGDLDGSDALDFLRENGVAILLGVGVAVAVFLGFSVWKNYKASAAAEAETQLFQAEAPEQIQQVIDKYGSTPAAPLAYLALAGRYFDDGQYELAESVYTQFREKFPGHTFHLSAELGMAQCKEAAGRLQEALDAFTAFATAHPDSYLASLAIFGKARCLEQLGRFDEAKAVYEDYIAANPASLWADRADAAILYVEQSRRAAQRATATP